MGGSHGFVMNAPAVAVTTYDATTDTIHILKAGDTITDGANFAFGTTNGTKIGTSTAQKIGFYGKAPAVQQGPWTVTGVTPGLNSFNAASAGTSANSQAIGTIIQQLQAIGLIG